MHETFWDVQSPCSWCLRGEGVIMKVSAASKESTTRKNALLALTACLVGMLVVIGAFALLPSKPQHAAYADDAEGDQAGRPVTSAPQSSGALRGTTQEGENKCGENVTWALTDSTSTTSLYNKRLVISGSGPMCDFEDASKQPWADSRNKIDQIVIDKNVTYIGAHAFEGFTVGTIKVWVTEEGGSLSVGPYAFKDSGLAVIGVGIDANSNYHDSIAPIASVGDYAFQNCQNLSLFEFAEDDSVISIGKYAFQNCIHLVGAVSSDDPNASELVIPANISSIGEYAFNSCSALNTLSFDTGSMMSATGFGTKAFDGAGLSKVNSTSKNVYLYFRNNYPAIQQQLPESGGVIYTYDEGAQHVWVMGRTGSSGVSLEVPAVIDADPDDGQPGLFVIGIAEKAFYDDKNLHNVVFLGTLEGAAQQMQMTTIEESAFEGCIGVEQFNLPASVTTIGKSAFNTCLTLSTFSFASNAELTTIGEEAFYNCQSLGKPGKPLMIPKKVSTIGKNAFNFNRNKYTNGVDVVAFPNGSSLAEVVQYTFDGCKQVTLGAGTTKIGNSAFKSNTMLESVTLPKVTAEQIESGVSPFTAIGSDAFYGCSKLGSVAIPATTKTIDNNAFRGCSSLATVSFAEGSQLESIGTSAFESCTSLAQLPLATNANLASIGARAFYGCGKLSDVSFPSATTIIAEQMFYGCSSLKSFSVPATVASIGAESFRNCSKLATVIVLGDLARETTTTLDDSALVSIGASAFKDCKALERVDIPITVASIDTEAFQNCSALETVDFHMNPSPSFDGASYAGGESDLKTIGSYAFENCVALTSVVLPATLTSIGEKAFNNCSAIASVELPGDNVALDYKCFSGLADGGEIYVTSVTMFERLAGFDTFIDTARTKVRMHDASVHYIAEEGAVSITLLNTEYYITDPVKAIVKYKEGEIETLLEEGTNYTLLNEESTHEGKAVVLIKGIYPYLGYVRQEYCIDKAGIDEPSVIEGLKYTGEEQIGITPSENNKYTVEIGSATNAGSYTAKASLVDTTHYHWADGSTADKVYSWSIAPVAITIAPLDASKTYGDNDPDLTYDVRAASDADKALFEADKEKGAVGFSLTREPGENVVEGGYKIIAKAAEGQNYPNYALSFSDPATFKINPKNMSSAKITLDRADIAYPYTGQPVEPVVTAVTIGGESLKANDYMVSYADNEEVTNNAKVIVAGTGNYVGTATTTFAIKQITVTVTPVAVSKEYGDADPVFTATVVSSIEGDHPVIDYSLKRDEGENLGSYTIRATGNEMQGNYKVVFKTAKLTINRKSLTTDNIALSATTFPYSGEAQKPIVTVRAKAGGNPLVLGTDYTVSYSNNTNASTASSTAKATVTGRGNYAGTAAVPFTITQIPVTVMPVNASKVYGNSDPKLTANLVANNATDQAIVDKYKSSIRYTLKRDAGDATGSYAITATGNATQGNFAVTFGAPATFTINKQDLSLATVNLNKSTYTYTGKAAEPTVTVRSNGRTLKEGIDYKLAFANNVNAGTASVDITGLGNYMGSTSKTFTIQPIAVTVTPEAATKTYGDKDPSFKATVKGAVSGQESTIVYKLSRAKGENVGSYTITATGNKSQGNYTVSFGTARLTVKSKDMSNASIGLSKKVYPYTGSTVKPKPVVKVNGKKLKANVDYTVSYSNNVMNGKATVTVTGKGNYSGVKSRTFKIAGIAKGKTAVVAGATYKAKTASTVYYIKAPTNTKTVKVPAKVKIYGKIYKVTGIGAKAFKGTQAETVVVKSKKLTSKSVKKCFKGSKVETVKVPNTKKDAYKMVFTKKNCGKKVTVK